MGVHLTELSPSRHDSLTFSQQTVEVSYPPPSMPPRTAPVRRRVKPARSAKVGSLALSAVSTLGLVALFAQQNEESSSAASSPTFAPSLTTGTTTATLPFQTESTSGSTVSSPTTVAGAAANAADIADGVFVGVADNNRWGTVQVQIVVSGGLLTDVQVLSSPDSDRKSVRINERAMPTLTAEAIAAQDANINSVSGATYTWRSYTVSLQSALDAAHSAI